MYEQKELKIYTDKNLHIGGDFDSLWYQIAIKFNFIKIIYKNNELKKDKINVKYKIISDEQNEIIQCNYEWIHGQTIVIHDILNTNRYFIGFFFEGGYTEQKIAGMIVYFDNLGNMIDSYTKIFRNTVCSFDYRNGIINTSSSTLYNQCLIFGQVHRDTHTLLLNINLLDYNDNIISKSCSLVDIYSNKYDFMENNCNKYPRFYYIKGFDVKSNKKNDMNSFFDILIDLGSLKLLNNDNKSSFEFTNNLLNLNYYIISDDIVKFVSDFNKNSEIYSDGYPDNCIRCNRLTKNAIYNDNNTSMGLGNSFCDSCEIRYSKSNNCWECCKIEKSNIIYNLICSSKLSYENNYICNNFHLDNTKLVINYIKSINPKYPNKENVNVISKSI